MKLSVGRKRKLEESDPEESDPEESKKSEEGEESESEEESEVGEARVELAGSLRTNAEKKTFYRRDVSLIFYGVRSLWFSKLFLKL